MSSLGSQRSDPATKLIIALDGRGLLWIGWPTARGATVASQ
jgi:hypothetical protein